MTWVKAIAVEQRYTRFMIRRLSHPLLLLIILAYPLMGGWMMAAHAGLEPSSLSAPPAASQVVTHDHGVATAHAQHSESDCAMQMGGACLQLCSLSAMPCAAPPLSANAGQHHAAFVLSRPAGPFLEQPFPPPKF
jgi:hypothetical protein